HVIARSGHGRGQVQRERGAGLHVGGAAPVEEVTVHCGWEVLGQRYRVEMAGQDDPPRPAEVRTRADGVADPAQRQVRRVAERRLDRVGDLPLVARDGLDVDQGPGQRDGIGENCGVESGHAAEISTVGIVPDFTTSPAWGTGLATATTEGQVLDVWYPTGSASARTWPAARP